MIIMYEPDTDALAQLEDMLKKALPTYEFKGFTTLEDCTRCVEQENNVDIVFLDLDSCMPLSNVQEIVEDIRAWDWEIDIVLLTAFRELDIDTAGWAIKSKISSALRKPYQYEKLKETLAHIWFHKIPEYDAVLNHNKN